MFTIILGRDLGVIQDLVLVGIIGDLIVLVGTALGDGIQVLVIILDLDMVINLTLGVLLSIIMVMDTTLTSMEIITITMVSIILEEVWHTIVEEEV